VALVDSLVDELLGEYEYGTNPERWEAVQKAYNKMRDANNAGDQLKAMETFEELGLLIEEGHGHAQQSLAILHLLEARRRHADSETSRKLSEGMTFTYSRPTRTTQSSAPRRAGTSGTARSAPPRSSTRSQPSETRLRSETTVMDIPPSGN
jgi:hypothetical protein